MEIFQPLLSYAWTAVLITLFLGGSIFVHELGHFLVARHRGMVVVRFSIGFGPAIWKWHDKAGIEYRVSALPLGGYVALPQLVDMNGVEGESTKDISKLPPPSYTTLMLVFGAGVTCNLLFALALACLLWVVGQPSSADLTTTRIGYVQAALDSTDAPSAMSPAAEAGLQIGDTVTQIDGRPIDEWQDLVQNILISSGHEADGRRATVFTINRGGKIMDVTVHPVLAGVERTRRVGIAPYYEMIVLKVNPDTLAADADLRKDDRIVSLDGTPVFNYQTFDDILAANPDRDLALVVRRGAANLELTIPAHSDAEVPADVGADFMSERILVHPTPFKLIGSIASFGLRSLGSLLNRNSDIGISKVSGPVGIAHLFYQASQVDIRLVLWLTILINVSLAIFNLLPIPVLDGGHMLFATIGKLRGRALPPSFIATTQSVFIALLLSMVVYVTFFDARRWVRDAYDSRPPPPPPAATEPAPAK